MFIKSILLCTLNFTANVNSEYEIAVKLLTQPYFPAVGR